ncbi:transposable element tc3 transposase [Vespula squamosa]|uniref:Transposable element tc3 transposase n=1 Tax=Vespula squamosa TaxID=30214 RepID=A0ABD2BGA0_VESSQ
MNRVEFCRWIIRQIQNNKFFLNTVLFTDEVTFVNNANVNLHNIHLLTAENPHWLRQVEHQKQWSVNVWCGIIGDKIIGPCFINGNSNEELPSLIRQTMWYQHDGCPAHYSLIVRRELDEKFRNRWIGRGGPISWSARSPDITPLDFFL